MRAVALMLLVACHARPQPQPGPAPARHESPHRPHFDPTAPLDTEALVGRWRYGRNSPAGSDQATGLSVDALGHGALLTLRPDGSYTEITLGQTHPANCAISIVEWEQGTWSATGNAINLVPAGAHMQVIDYCDPSRNGQRPKQPQPASYVVQLGRDGVGDWIVLYLPDGRRHSGPYYREAS